MLTHPKKNSYQNIPPFITSQINYSNSCIYLGQINQQLLVQNAAARFLTNTRRRQHITVRFRIEDLNVFFYKASHGTFIPFWFTLSMRSLRSPEQQLPQVPKARYKDRGSRAFLICSPSLWNHIPLPGTLSPTHAHFKPRLRTSFYSLAFPFT